MDVFDDEFLKTFAHNTRLPNHHEDGEQFDYGLLPGYRNWPNG